MEELIVISVCLVLNALLAAYEMAFVSVPKSELRRLAKDGVGPAVKLVELRNSPERTLSIMQIGITLVGAISAAVGGAGASESIEPYFRSNFGLNENAAEGLSILLVVLPLTYLSVVVGELVPKSLALKNPLKITMWGARPLFVADRLLSPLVTVLEWSTRQVLKLFKTGNSKEIAPAETTLEIDSLPAHHQQALVNLAHIEERKLRDIVLPWSQVVSVNVAQSMDEIALQVFASGHTRLPVMNENMLEGVLHTKEFLGLRETGGDDWTRIIRPILRVRAQDSILATLRLMQTKRSHMAAVLGAQGERLGIVTFEDISEEIWGEIFDEDDDSRIQKIFANRVKMKMPPQR